MDDTIQNNTTRNRLQITLIATTTVASHQYPVNFSYNVSNARESKLRLDKPRVKPYFTRLFCISLPPSLPRHRAAMSTSRQCPRAASHPPHHPLCCGTASTPSPSLLRHSCTAPGCIQAAMPKYTWDQAMSTWTTVLRARRCHRARPARSARSDELSRASPILSILHPSCQTSAQPSRQPSHALQHFPSSKLSPLRDHVMTHSLQDCMNLSDS